MGGRRHADPVARLEAGFIEARKETPRIDRAELACEPSFIAAPRSVETPKIAANRTAKGKFELRGSARNQMIEVERDRLGIRSFLDASAKSRTFDLKPDAGNAKSDGMEFELVPPSIDIEFVGRRASEGFSIRVEIESEIDRGYAHGFR